MQEGSREWGGILDLTGYDSEDDAEDVSTDGPIVLSSHQVNEKALELERQHAGQIFFTETVQNLMKDMFNEVYVALQPKAGDWEARKLVIEFIKKFVKYKISGSSISAFGSFVMDLYTAGSDLDLSLNISDGRRERSRNDKVHYLRKVANALYGLQNGQRTVRGIETVYRAAVPVVKFVECKTGIECDISVENNDGVLKSQVLGMFATIDSRFRQLCYLVKSWAKKHNVNSSKNGTLNSLSICLLVAFHLQTCSPPILPPFSVFMEGLYLPAVDKCLHIVAARVRTFKDSGFGSDNLETVPELFGSFFVKLVAVENLWGHGLCSSTYEGRWISKIWPKNHIGCISVEDFADRTQNVARSVSRKEFELIYQCLHATLSNLKDPVSNVMDTKDLRVYLFGSNRQRHRGTDHAKMAATYMETWQSANGWSSGDNHSTLSTSRGHHIQAESAIHVNQSTFEPRSGASGYGYNSRTGPGTQHSKARNWQSAKHERDIKRVNVFSPPERDCITHMDLVSPEHDCIVTHMDLVSPERVMNVVQPDNIERVRPFQIANPDSTVRVVNLAGFRVDNAATNVDLVKRSFPFREAEQPATDFDQKSVNSRNRNVFRNGAQASRVPGPADTYDGSLGYGHPSQVGQGGYSALGNRSGSYQPIVNGQGISASQQKHRRYGRGNRGGRAAQTQGLSGDARPHNTSNHQPRTDKTVDGRWQTQAPSHPHEFLISR